MTVSRNEKVAFQLSLKMKMARLSISVRRRSCMLRSGASGTKTLTHSALLITGPLRVPLFVTSSETYSKTNFRFYVFVLSDGRSRHFGRKIITAGSDPYWIGGLGRHCSVLATRIMVASASDRSLSFQNPRIPMMRVTSRSMYRDQRK